MNLENNTALSASLLRGALPTPDTTLAVVIAKAVGVFDARGELRLDLGASEAIRSAPSPHELGHIPADIALRKDGLDIMALGQAYHPDPDGGPESTVSISIAEDTRSLRIFGERSWYKNSQGEWAISEPEPFSRLDLTWANSFGGTSYDEWDNDCPHPLNPEGMGYIASEEAIEDTSLPNIEDPQQLIRSWQDHPNPINIAPAPKPIALDAAKTLETLHNHGPETYKVPDAIWNDAVPRFRFQPVQPGTVVVLSGMAESALHARVPRLTLEARVELGVNQHVLPLTLDTLLFYPEERRCIFTYRTTFQYRFVPRQTRVVRLDAVFSK